MSHTQIRTTEEFDKTHLIPAKEERDIKTNSKLFIALAEEETPRRDRRNKKAKKQ